MAETHLLQTVFLLMSFDANKGRGYNYHLVTKVMLETLPGLSAN